MKYDTHITLLTKLGQAQEGSRELDVCVGKAVGWHGSNWSMGWLPPEVKLTEASHTRHQDMPAFTTNLQAAVDLVPEGLPWHMESAGIVEMGTSNGPVEGIAATPALALCIAILKAHHKFKKSS